MDKIIIFNPHTICVNTDKIKAACDKMKVETFFSDFSFCPYLYSFKDDKGVTKVGNLNEGAVQRIRKEYQDQLITADTLENFIREVFSLRFSKKEDDVNALF